VARILIVGCGCRGRELGASLVEQGHMVRGTSRRPAGLEAIEAVCGEAATADPDRLGTVLPALAGVSVACWLMGSATGPPELVGALHGARLQSLLVKLVDTQVRGLVYEAAGTVPAEVLAEGGVAVRRAAATYRMPVSVVEQSPQPRDLWRAAMLAAVDEVLAA